MPTNELKTKISSHHSIDSCSHVVTQRPALIAVPCCPTVLCRMRNEYLQLSRTLLNTLLSSTLLVCPAELRLFICLPSLLLFVSRIRCLLPVVCRTASRSQQAGQALLHTLTVSALEWRKESCCSSCWWWRESSAMLGPVSTGPPRPAPVPAPSSCIAHRYN